MYMYIPMYTQTDTHLVDILNQLVDILEPVMSCLVLEILSEGHHDVVGGVMLGLRSHCCLAWLLWLLVSIHVCSYW